MRSFSFKTFTSWSSEQNILVRVVERVEDLSLDRVEVGELVQLLELGISQSGHLKYSEELIKARWELD